MFLYLVHTPASVGMEMFAGIYTGESFIRTVEIRSFIFYSQTIHIITLIINGNTSQQAGTRCPVMRHLNVAIPHPVHSSQYKVITVTVNLDKNLSRIWRLLNTFVRLCVFFARFFRTS